MSERIVRSSVLVAWLCTLPILTVMRVPIWANNLMLWESAVQVTPERPRAWINYAVTLSTYERWPDTEAALREAIRVGSPIGIHQEAQRTLLVALAWQNLGAIASHRGDLVEAAKDYQAAVDLWPGGTLQAPLHVGGELHVGTTALGIQIHLPKAAGQR